MRRGLYTLNSTVLRCRLNARIASHVVGLQANCSTRRGPATEPRVWNSLSADLRREMQFGACCWTCRSARCRPRRAASRCSTNFWRRSSLNKNKIKFFFQKFYQVTFLPQRHNDRSLSYLCFTNLHTTTHNISQHLIDTVPISTSQGRLKVLAVV